MSELVVWEVLDLAGVHSGGPPVAVLFAAVMAIKKNLRNPGAFMFVTKSLLLAFFYIALRNSSKIPWRFKVLRASLPFGKYRACGY